MTNFLTELKPRKIELFEFGDINLFEIDDSGTILYCLIDNQRPPGEHSVNSIGRNIFDEALLFENTEDLRRKFKDFLKGNLSTANFQFTFQAKDQSTSAQVKFLRIVERVDSQSVNSTIVDIRRFSY